MSTLSLLTHMLGEQESRRHRPAARHVMPIGARVDPVPRTHARKARRRLSNVTSAGGARLPLLPPSEEAVGGAVVNGAVVGSVVVGGALMPSSAHS